LMIGLSGYLLIIKITKAILIKNNK